MPSEDLGANHLTEALDFRPCMGQGGVPYPFVSLDVSPEAPVVILLLECLLL